MKRAAIILAALAAILTATAAPVRTATEGFVTNRIAAAAAATLQSANDYTDAAISGAGGLTPEMVTNIVRDVAPAPGNYAAVSNAAMNAVQPSDLAAATNATATSIDAKRDKADLSVYARRWSEWTFSGSRVNPSKTYSINLFPEEQWDGRILWTFDLREDGEPLNTYELVLTGGVEPDFVTLITPDMWMEHVDMDVTATRRRVDVPTDDRLATTSGVSRAISAAVPQAVTNIVRDLSLGGIWDSQLEVWWTPRMRNGSLTYEATTNVNLNAEN